MISKDVMLKRTKAINEYTKVLIGESLFERWLEIMNTSEDPLVIGFSALFVECIYGNIFNISVPKVHDLFIENKEEWEKQNAEFVEDSEEVALQIEELGI